MTANLDPSTRFVLPADSPLLANLEALWAADIPLALELEPLLDAGPYPAEPSKSGPPTLALPAPDGRALYLHSRYQPADEARRLIATVDVQSKAVFCIFGLGLGYHVEALFDRMSDEALVIVYEPDLRLILTAFQHRDLSQLLSTRRLTLLTRIDRAALMLRYHQEQALVSMGVGFITHPPTAQFHARFISQAEDCVNEFVAYCRTSMNTLVINGRRTCGNIARNVPWYVANPGIARLRNRHAGQPAIIVSAGPSLRKNQHLLRQAVGHAVIIAVQTTLQPLLEMGIEPDYVTSLDYSEVSTRFFEKLPRNLRTELIAEPKASSSILALYPGPVTLIGNDFADRLLHEMPLDRPRLRSGATVAHLAFYLAEIMGSDPVIFVGQDLGFSDGLCYSPGTSYEDVWRPELGRFCTMEMKQWEHIARERPILRQIEDYQGRPMYTEERLFSYLQQFERDFAQSRVRVIDATEGGARKRGTTAMTLADALQHHCALPIPALPSDHPGPDWNALPACRASLQKRREEAAAIREIAHETLPLLAEVRDHIDDQPRVNRLIAHIDALRARMNRHNDCYELVIQLTQKTELARFHSDRKLAASRATGLERQKRQLARDIVNVQGIVDAAAEFQELIDQVGDELTRLARSHGVEAA